MPSRLDKHQAWTVPTIPINAEEISKLLILYGREWFPYAGDYGTWVALGYLRQAVSHREGLAVYKFKARLTDKAIRRLERERARS